MLANATSSERLGECLDPLLDGYEAWILSAFDEREIPIHSVLKEEALNALNRMKKGVEFLKNDEFARAAFNVANEALNLNAQWRTSNSLKWRKFQLAFALSTIESAVRTESTERTKLDLLWVATGGGKTEAYLLISAFVLAYRRLTQTDDEVPHWQGVNIITRYTLRLLTIQQFRRTLGMVTALEYIRATRNEDNHPWKLGNQQFSIGMWVGGGVSPNKFSGKSDRDSVKATDIEQLRLSNSELADEQYLDVDRKFKTLELLTGGNALSSTKAKKASEPAQIINCPCCQSWLSFPRGGDDYKPELEAEVHWVVETNTDWNDLKDFLMEDPSMHVSTATVTKFQGDIITLSLNLHHPDGINETTVEAIASKIQKVVTVEWGDTFSYKSARPSRPGYFLRYAKNTVRNLNLYYDFEIRCPSPACELNSVQWCSELPSGSVIGRDCKHQPQQEGSSFPVEILPEWRITSNDATRARGIPIPAFTCDYQVYNRLPSIVIATVDKFARLPFEPQSGSLFGNVTHHDEMLGFMRQNAGTNGNITSRRKRTTPSLMACAHLNSLFKTNFT